MRRKFKVRIITPKRIVFEDEVQSISAPSSSGEITILYNHTPFFSILNQGIVKIKKDSQELLFSIGGGYIETNGKETNVLVSRAYHQDEIDEALVKKAREEAERLLKEAKTEEERQRAKEIHRRSFIDSKLLRGKRRKKPGFGRQ